MTTDKPCDIHPPDKCDAVICGKCARYKSKDGACICATTEPETHAQLYVQAMHTGYAASADGKFSISIPVKDLPCPICEDEIGKLQEKLDEMTRERDAYRKAKQENDERFMNERDEAREQVVKLKADLEIAKTNLDIGDAEMAWALTDFRKLETKVVQLNAAVYEVIGQQHVMKHTLGFVGKWGDDPTFLDPVQRKAEVERVEAAITEWHRRLVAAVELGKAPTTSFPEKQ